MTWIKQPASLIRYMISEKNLLIIQLPYLRKKDLNYQTHKEFEMNNWENLTFAIRTTIVFGKD